MSRSSDKQTKCYIVAEALSLVLCHYFRRTIDGLVQSQNPGLIDWRAVLISSYNDVVLI